MGFIMTFSYIKHAFYMGLSRHLFRSDWPCIVVTGLFFFWGGGVRGKSEVAQAVLSFPFPLQCSTMPRPV